MEQDAKQYSGMDALRRYVELTAKKKSLDKELDDIKESIEAIKETVLTYMQDEGMQSVKIADHLLYLRRDIRATFLETPESVLVAKNHGYGDALRTIIYPQTASSIVREQIKDLGPDEKIPDWIKEAFSYYDGLSPAIRKS